MFRLIVAAAIFATLAFTARAADVVDSSLKSRALASAAAPVAKQSSDAPFMSARDPMPFLLMQDEQDRRSVRGGNCEAAAGDLCFDAADGRIVYRSARRFMPQFDGLTPESVSVRGHRVTLKYSFK
jgi:hypothetical protein